jgi:hypothetical protein
MPYASDAQRKFMHAVHPDIAARWDAEAAGKKDPEMGDPLLNEIFNPPRAIQPAADSVPLEGRELKT